MSWTKLYLKSIENHEPFKMLEIRSVKEHYIPEDITSSIESCNENERSFYGLYAQSDDEGGLWWSIADSSSKLDLLELAKSFNVFSKHTLPIITKFTR